MGIQKLGVPAELEKRSLDIRNHYQSKLSASCFSASAKYEIVVHGKKMVGSAQRRLSTGVLQHGSILLGRGNFALPDFLKDVKPEEKENMGRILRGKSITLEESLGRKVSFRRVVSAIKKGMTENLHVKFDKSELTEEERRRGSELEEQFSVLAF
jgi:lipoate-protein ligase A